MALRRLFGRSPLGTWLMSGSPTVAEAMACQPLDFLVLDLEHAPVPLDAVLHVARAVASRGKALVVRLPDHDPTRLRWMLDAGIETLMVPMVGTPDEARALAAAIDYPPGGARGYAAMLRANGYGTDPGYAAGARERITLIAQIETPNALEAMEDIGAVPGVDALFLGPGDLSATTGQLGRATGEATLALIRGAIGRCRAAGVPVGTVMPTPELVRAMLAEGCAFAAVGSDLAFATAGARAAAAGVRGDGARSSPEEPGRQGGPP